MQQTQPRPASLTRLVLLTLCLSLGPCLSSLAEEPLAEIILPSRALEGHEKDVTSLDFSHDGRQVLSASSDATIRLWDLSSGKEVRRFEGDLAAFSPDDRFVLAATKFAPAATRGDLCCWDARSGALVHKVEGLPDLSSLAFSPDGKYAIACTRDYKLIVLDAQTWGSRRDIEKNLATVVLGKTSRSLAMSFTRIEDPDFPTMLEFVASYPGGHSGLASAAMLLPSHSQQPVIILGKPYELVMLDLGKKQVLREFIGHAGGDINTIDLSPDGKRLLSATPGDRYVRYWEVATGRELLLLKREGGLTRALAFSPDGRMALASGGAKILLYDLENGTKDPQIEEAARVLEKAGPSEQARQSRPRTQRYKDQGDGVIVDQETGLMWTQRAGAPLDWEQSRRFCEKLKLGGHDDWRLPTSEELVDLHRALDYEYSMHQSSGAPFDWEGPYPVNSCWSSNLWERDPQRRPVYVPANARGRPSPANREPLSNREPMYFTRAVRGQAGSRVVADSSVKAAPSFPEDGTRQRASANVLLGTHKNGDTVSWGAGKIWRDVTVASVRNSSGKLYIRIDDPPKGCQSRWYTDFEWYEKPGRPNRVHLDGSTTPAGEPVSSEEPAAMKYRTWTDTSGRFSVEAEFVTMAMGTVKLRKADGTEVSVPLDRLSEEDQKWVQDRGR